MFIVTGTPRAATGYWSMLLSAADIPTSHERLFRPRASLREVLDWWGSGGDRGESSWLGWVFLPVLPDPPPVIHTVRNPWKVIDSLAHRNDMLPAEAKRDRGKLEFESVIRHYCPRVFDFDSAEDRAAAMVVDWNRAIISTASISGAARTLIRAEEIDSRILLEILEWLGIRRTLAQIEKALAETPRNVNGGREIEYNVEVKHPLVRAYLGEVFPGRPPVIDRVLSKATPRDSGKIRASVDPGLAAEVDSLAEEFGYTIGEIKNESRNERAAV